MNNSPPESNKDLPNHAHTSEVLIIGCLLGIILFLGTPLFGKVFPDTAGHSLKIIRESDIKQRS